MKKAYPEAIGIIDQFTGPNFLENPVIIPYKITLKRQAKLLGFRMELDLGWKYPLITDLIENAPLSNHAKKGNLILKIKTNLFTPLNLNNINVTQKLKQNLAE